MNVAHGYPTRSKRKKPGIQGATAGGSLETSFAAASSATPSPAIAQGRRSRERTAEPLRSVTPGRVVRRRGLEGHVENPISVDSPTRDVCPDGQGPALTAAPRKGSSGQDQDSTLTRAPDQLAPAPGQEAGSTIVNPRDQPFSRPSENPWGGLEAWREDHPSLLPWFTDAALGRGGMSSREHRPQRFMDPVTGEPQGPTPPNRATAWLAASDSAAPLGGDEVRRMEVAFTRHAERRSDGFAQMQLPWSAREPIWEPCGSLFDSYRTRPRLQTSEAEAAALIPGVGWLRPPLEPVALPNERLPPANAELGEDIWATIKDQIARACNHPDLTQYLGDQGHRDLPQSVEQLLRGEWNRRVGGLRDVLQLCHKWALFLQWEVTPRSLPKLLVDAANTSKVVVMATKMLAAETMDYRRPIHAYWHFWGPLTYGLSRGLEFFLQACRIAELKASEADILANATSASLQAAFRPLLEKDIGGSRAGGLRPIDNHLAVYQGASWDLPTSRRGPRLDATGVVTGVSAGERAPAQGVGPMVHTLLPEPNLDALSAVRSHADELLRKEGLPILGTNRDLAKGSSTSALDEEVSEDEELEGVTPVAGLLDEDEPDLELDPMLSTGTAGKRWKQGSCNGTAANRLVLGPQQACRGHGEV
ncbi:hypothetical protein Vafri_1849 [Volvox africanus]|nr:hypothetical protein Vafri_1849 [Volvox africanus]